METKTVSTFIKYISLYELDSSMNMIGIER